MVIYNSQYRKHYKDPRWDEFAVSEYSRKVDYRLGRRSVEHLHQPWDWDSDDEDSDTSARATVREKPEVREKATETTDQKHRKIKNSEEIKEGLNEKTVAKINEQHGQKQNKKYDENREEKQVKRHQKRIVVYDDQKPRQRRHCKSAAANSKVQESPKKEPFVPYGWANEGPIDKKYTYNVKASPTEVYPASLRALKRRELDVKRKLFQNRQKASVEQEIIKEKMFKDARASATFLTEYQRSYCLQKDAQLADDFD